ncbi:MAG: penicillin-binding protein 2 [Patescibacteria group bacterium]|jgi:penicillin-binding protein 2|nr:penicillin-binding protein 2 [Patescibacteria group bacterium]
MLSRKKRKTLREIAPDEILLDASTNDFDKDRFEGRLERPLRRRTFLFTGGVLALIFTLLTVRAGFMQIVHGADYEDLAQRNQLSQTILFADRGLITDRTGLPLAYNERGVVGTTTQEFATRVYAAMRGIAHVVGYAKSPAKDKSGSYYRNEFIGIDGAEKAFDAQLSGVNGMELTQTDAHGKVIAQSVTQPQEPGQQIALSIDAKLTQGLYDALAQRAEDSKFQGGAAVVMDIYTGEIVAMTSYPEFSQNALAAGDSAAFRSINTDSRRPFLNRATSGLYAPGSIVKPVVAAGALTEGIISPNKQILSTGSISLPNPYDPERPSVFKDWRAHGWVDVRKAIAVSSDVYFYEVGGGFQGQPGLGIDRLDKYFRLFGFAEDPGLVGFPTQDGNIPTAAWKAKYFPEDPTWRVGDTYHTAIGQYGMQVTPLQAARATAAVANGGKLVTPVLVASSTVQAQDLHISESVMQIVREGMRMSVTEGIAGAVKFDFVHVAAKTGTAQVGVRNEYVNSWMIGFFPYEHPRYAYAIVLERGPQHTTIGSPAAVGQFFLWMRENAPQYLTP